MAQINAGFFIKLNRPNVYLIALLLMCFFSPVFARDWYVSAEWGKGKNGTIEEPASDLGNIISIFNEKHDPIAIYGGSSVMIESETLVSLSTLAVDSDVWLPRMSLEDVFALAGRYLDNYGVFTPVPEAMEAYQ